MGYFNNMLIDAMDAGQELPPEALQSDFEAGLPLNPNSDAS